MRRQPDNKTLRFTRNRRYWAHRMQQERRERNAVSAVVTPILGEADTPILGENDTPINHEN